MSIAVDLNVLDRVKLAFSRRVYTERQFIDQLRDSLNIEANRRCCETPIHEFSESIGVSVNNIRLVTQYSRLGTARYYKQLVASAIGFEFKKQPYPQFVRSSSEVEVDIIKSAISNIKITAPTAFKPRIIQKKLPDDRANLSRLAAEAIRSKAVEIKKLPSAYATAANACIQTDLGNLSTTAIW